MVQFCTPQLPASWRQQELPYTLEDIRKYPVNILHKHHKFSGRDKLDKIFEEAGLIYRVGLYSRSSSGQ